MAKKTTTTKVAEDKQKTTTKKTKNTDLKETANVTPVVEATFIESEKEIEETLNGISTVIEADESASKDINEALEEVNKLGAEINEVEDVISNMPEVTENSDVEEIDNAIDAVSGTIEQISKIKEKLESEIKNNTPPVKCAPDVTTWWNGVNYGD